MTDRNEDREIFLNDHKIYKNLLKSRGVGSFRHYGKLKIANFTPEALKELQILDHLWKTGDRLSKLSHKYYGDTRYWWIISVFNKKAIDTMYSPGDIVHIPLPLEEVLYYVSRDV